MKPRFAVVDKLMRDKFEKKWQMPYGYGNCFVSTDPEEAIRYYEERIPEYETTFVVEKFDVDGREVIYRR
jgi:hypothetical protein